MKAGWAQVQARPKIQVRMFQRRLKSMSSAVWSAALLAAVCLMLLSPLLLDDFVFLRSNLFRASQDTLTIFKPVVLNGSPRVTIAQGVLSMPPILSGKARTGEALAALVQGGSARLALESPVFSIELSSNRLSALDEPLIDGVQHSLADIQSPLMDALESGGFETLSIRNGTINIISLTGHTEVLSHVSADVTVKRKSAIRSKGTFTLRGEEFGFDTTFGTRIERRNVARMPIKAHIYNRLIDATIEGRLDLTGSLELVAPSAEIKLVNVRALGRWLGHIWPSGPGLMNIVARGSLDWRGDTISLQKGDITVDGNAATGTIALRLSADRPLLVGTLGFESFNLTPYFVQPAGREPDDRGLLTLIKSQRDFAMPLLSQINVDLRFSANSVTLGSWQAGRGAAGLTVTNGQAVLDVADLALEGQSRLSAIVQLSSSPTVPVYQTSGKIEGVDLGPLTAAMVGTPALSGRGNVTFQMRANGISGLDILSRASGKIAIELPKGGTAACTIKSLVEVAQAKGTPAAPLCRAGTTLSTLTGLVVVTDGVAVAEKVLATTATDNLRVDGMIDLVSSLLDLTVISTPLVQSRADPAGSGRDSVSIRGRIEAPIFAIKRP